MGLIDDLRTRELHPDDWVWITPEERDSLLRAIEAADRYANWDLPRIIPTEECPDAYTALCLLRDELAALSALDTEEPK